MRPLASRHSETPDPTLVAIDGRQMRELTGRLDAIVRLLAINLPTDMKQETKARLLSDSGFQPKEIARVLGTTPNAVSVALSKMRKRDRAEQTAAEGGAAPQNEAQSPQEQPATPREGPAPQA